MSVTVHALRRYEVGRCLSIHLLYTMKVIVSRRADGLLREVGKSCHRTVGLLDTMMR
jgi:hypothetical protein